LDRKFDTPQSGEKILSLSGIEHTFPGLPALRHIGKEEMKIRIWENLMTSAIFEILKPRRS
jgi:hypothetical protein